MFTGIVDHTGTIVLFIQQQNSCRLGISCQFTEIQEGESICVDGVCLTAISAKDGYFECDVSPETLKLTTIGQLHEGAQVNLERSLRAGDRFGGHFVYGHVDKTAQIEALAQQGEYYEVQIGGLAAADMVYLTKKGSIAIQGVSLTINEVTERGFKVMLVPHTLARTSLSQLSVGKRVNLEFDGLVKIVLHRLDLLQGSLHS